MIAWLRFGCAAAVLVSATLLLIPVQYLALRCGWRLARTIPVFWHRLACRAAGIRVRRVGVPHAGRPLLIAANHQSWADILVLGSIMPLAFVAKSEVGSWPVFGLLAKLQRTVFVVRADRRRTGEQAGSIAARLRQGDAMVLFAEGTTSDGNEILPFKTALFAAAQGAVGGGEGGAGEAGERTRGVAVQPVSIAYTHLHGLPLGRRDRPLAAWPGDVELLPHLLAFMREGAIDAEVRFGEVTAFEKAADRKAIARTAQRRVARMHAASLRGRDGTREPAIGERETLAHRHDADDIKR